MKNTNKKNIKKTKMNGEERKLSIVRAATSIFSKKGFHGASVRNIADAAGVSEALLYKHFSSKEDLYLSLGEYVEVQLISLIDGFKDQKPGGKMLIEIVYCLVMMILTDMPGKTEMQRAFERLLAYSLLENTDFSKNVFLSYEKGLGPLWEKSLEEAKKNNELKRNAAIKNTMWFVHHLSMAINFLHLSDTKLFAYDGSYEELLEGIIKFALSGTGLTEETIALYYKPAILKRKVIDIFG